MKKKSLFFITLLCLFILTVFTCAYAKNLPEEYFNLPALKIPGQAEIKEDATKDESKEPQFILPASLTIIEDEAFEGTAITDVVLQEKVVFIGDYAFANIPTLRKINIPDSTAFIGKNVFKDSANVTITGAPKGYARAWAQENGIPFNPITTFYAFSNTVQINGLTKGSAERLETDSEATEDKKPNPTGRMTGELKAEKYEFITAFHIQGRSPPMA